MSDRAVEAVLRPVLPVDLAATLWPLRRGTGDPTMRVEPTGAWWRATRTPEGPAAVRLEARPRTGEVHVRAWGEGAAWAVEAAPDLLGARDTLDGFDPSDRVVRELHRRHPGLRITRSRAVFEAILPAVLEQKVTGLEARSAFRALALAFGEPAPGPAGLRLPPAPEALAARPYFELHPLGIVRRTAELIRTLAARASRLEEALGLEPAAAERRLRSFAGIGPWTAAEVAIVALGDADAVSVGDYHLPDDVAWVLAGEPRGDDRRMLELLEPYRGHRGRVLRLIGASGMHAPRWGPRATARSFRAI